MSPTRTTRSTSAAPELVVGGMFRKLGSKVKNWKERRYEVFSNGVLKYFDGDAVEPQGVVVLNRVRFSTGDESHIDASGCMDFSEDDGVAIAMEFDDTEARIMQLVFDSPREAKSFLEGVRTVCPDSNAQEFMDASPALCPKPVNSRIERSSTLVSALSTAEPTAIIHQGKFRKKGSFVKSWKERSYTIFGNGNLRYFDPSSGEEKGTIDVYNVIVKRLSQQMYTYEYTQQIQRQ